MKEKPVFTKEKIIILSFLTLLYPIGKGLILYAQRHPQWVEDAYSRGWFTKAGRVLTGLTGKSSFSWMEITLLLCILVACGFLIGWILEIIRQPGKTFLICLKRIWTLTAIGIGIFFYFICCGDLNYYRISVGETLGCPTEQTTLEDLENLCDYLIPKTNEAREKTGTISENVFSLNATFEKNAKIASEAVVHLNEVFNEDCFAMAERTVPKGMIFSEVMSKIHLTGVIFPYLMEPNINRNQSQFSIPYTMCHELGHICGYMREDECNFIGYLACIHSDNSDFIYSAYLEALIYAGNALSRYIPDAWQEIYASLDEGVVRDLVDNYEYWYQYENETGRKAEAVNDAYLKANQQTDGIQSYGRMVDLLIAYEKSEHHI